MCQLYSNKFENRFIVKVAKKETLVVKVVQDRKINAAGSVHGDVNQ